MKIPAADPGRSEKPSALRSSPALEAAQRLRVLIAAPTLTRRLYQRGGFESFEANTLQVLIAVQEMQEPTVGELVEALALGQGTVSTALGRLEHRGLVSAYADQQDARRARQRITRKGRALRDTIGSLSGLRESLCRLAAIPFALTRFPGLGRRIGGAARSSRDRARGTPRPAISLCARPPRAGCRRDRSQCHR
jgi:DNA-binding MarR family transcriptional regulator